MRHVIRQCAALCVTLLGVTVNAQEPESAPKVTVAVIPLHGTVGCIDGEFSESFDGVAIRDWIARAKKLKATVIVFDLQSPGGRVDVKHDVCEAILETAGDVRCVAWTGDAFSAASTIALSCKEIVARPQSRIGAAVVIDVGVAGNGTPTAVDAKFASADLAKDRTHLQQSGQPEALAAAMSIQATQLWWSEQHGFTTQAPPAETGGWRHLDDDKSILTLTGKDAVEVGLAKGPASELDELLHVLQLPSDANVIDLSKYIVDYNEALDRKIAAFQRGVEQYQRNVVELGDALVEILRAVRDQERTRIVRAKGKVSTAVAKLESSRLLLVRIDRSLLQRSVVLDVDVLFMRLEQDRELAAELRDRLNTNKFDGLQDALDRFRIVADAWADLLSQSSVE